MATWPHLYQERVAYLFAAGLYWQRFADVRENPADLCFFAPVRSLVTRREHLAGLFVCERKRPSGGCESVSGRGTAPQSCAAFRPTRKGRDCRLPGVGEGADVFAAARPGSPHDYGEDRRIPAPRQLVPTSAG